MHRLRPIHGCLVLMMAHAHAATMTLDRAVQLALKHDPTYLSVCHDAEAAHWGVRMAQADWGPSLQFLGQHAHVHQTHQGGHGQTHQYGLYLDQKLFDLPSWHHLAQARLADQQAMLTKALAKQQTMHRAASLYFNVMTAFAEEDAARTYAKALYRQYQQIKQRHAVGMVARPDLLHARAQYLTQKATVSHQHAQVQHAIQALYGVTGQQTQSFKTLGGKLPMPHPNPGRPDAWSTMALHHNLALMVAGKAVASADALLAAGRSGHAPTLALQASHVRSRPWLPGATGTTTSVHQIVLKMTWAWYTSGKIAATVQQLRQYAAMARDAQVKARRAAQTQARNGYVDVVAAIQQVKATYQALLASKAAASAMQDGYRVGTQTLTDVLRSLANTDAARRQYTTARYQYLQRVLTLKLAVGALQTKDIQHMAQHFTQKRRCKHF